MALLFRILRAAHARGSHHKLALDALEQLSCPEAEGWRRVFLKHAELYMQGSKAPDNEFKDFKNHVLHVRDNYWGGAPDKVQSWYTNLVDALKGQRWSEAVWAAGVLSHYYTDPIHPFHTAQSEAENNVHRAVEWSINRSYDALKQQGDAEFSTIRAQPGETAEWLREFAIEGAEASNRYYETLIAHYDINKGVVDPPAGLDIVSRKVVAELIRHAVTGFGAILDRAIADAAVSPPPVSLTVDTVLATLQIPIKQLMKRMDNKAEGLLVQRMYDELKATGRVEDNLPEDDRAVRDLFAKEVLADVALRRAEQRAAVLSRPSGGAPTRSRAAVAGPAVRPAAPASGDAGDTGSAAGTSGTGSVLAALSASRLQRQEPVSDAQGAAQAKPSSVPSVVRKIDEATKAERSPRVHLSLDDDIERAPSIGPKTAERFYRLGIRTVSDFLAVEAEELAGQLDVRHITLAVVESWQDQCRLVMDVPGLRGTHAQLLVGAGYRDAMALAEAEEGALSAAVLAFATTSDGQRVLREGQPPDLERIAGWIAAARARAA